MGQNLDMLRSGFETAFINGNLASNAEYKPSFVSNRPEEGKKVISSIEDELLRCEEFKISVAFVTMGGITPLLLALKELEKRGVPGKILTTNYLNFSEPRALEKLNELTNIELKMYDSEAADTGFHSKGYIFKKDETYRIITGSSNLTKTALTSNIEWNTRIISTEQGEIAADILSEFDRLWNSEYSIGFDEFFEVYKERYSIIKKQREIAASEKIVSLQKYTLKPNSMQEQFIVNLKKMLEKGEDRVLLISSTGTGKTYASAFAMRECGFKRVLFLVHRAQLAKQSMESYRMVFDDSVSMGLVGAGHADYEKDYVFATVQTLNREKHLTEYAKDEFDCIILDEAHHSSAGTYQKVMDYFEPKLFLGMTATPDKMDDNQEGKNIYEIFNYQIALEIRLQQAMENNLLCPFHYFGITEPSEINERETSDRSISAEQFRALTSDQRVKHIIEQVEYFGYSGDRVKGLVFCSRIDESVELSRKFNECGYRTIALNGSVSEEERERAFERLAMDEKDTTEDFQPLDYIFSVEILNEGVDIVEVNQVIMLRPTQSPIVFIQQLGRGLRKAKGKEYVVILDFIGNYKNNFMIPIALSGDRSYNKDTIRRYVAEGTRVIPGSSTIHFDEVARERIYQSIDKAKTNEVKFLKEAYENLRNRIGCVPTISDFKKYGSIEICKYFDKFGSYYAFLKKYYPDEYLVRLNEHEEIVVEYVSKKLTNTKRIHDLLLIKNLLQSRVCLNSYKRTLERDYRIALTDSVIESVVRNLTNEFPKEEERKKYAECVLLKESADGFELSENFESLLNTNEEFKEMVVSLIDYGIDNYNDNYSRTYKDTNFQLYQKYTYEDVCRLLNWKKNMNAQNIGGYFYDSETKTLPVFINYHKTEDAIAYEDRFVTNDRLIALSKHPRRVDSSDADHFYKRTEEDKDNKIYLFVRKNKDDKEAKEFYFLGEIYAQGEPNPIIMKGTGDNAFEIDYRLDVPVRDDIYDYIVSGE